MSCMQKPISSSRTFSSSESLRAGSDCLRNAEERAQILVEVQKVVEEFPNTTHPLLRNKLPGGDPMADVLEQIPSTQDFVQRPAIDSDGDFLTEKHSSDAEVDKRISAIEGLRDHLTYHHYRLADRLEFLDETLRTNKIDELLVACDDCENQYLVLTDEYYQTSAESRDNNAFLKHLSSSFWYPSS